MKIGKIWSSSFTFLLPNIGVDLLVIESGESRSGSVTLSHLEVLYEVFIAAPPVGRDHIQTLVTACLIEDGVADVVLHSVDWKSAVSVRGAALLDDLTESVPPVLQNAFLLWIRVISKESSYCSWSWSRGGRMSNWPILMPTSPILRTTAPKFAHYK